MYPRGETITLVWSVPRQNTNGTELVDLKGFKILRSMQSFNDECRECPKRFVVLYDMDYKTHMMNRPPSATIEYVDKELEFKTIYTYSVVSYTSADRYSSRSNNPVVYWDVPCSPPLNPSAILEGKMVILSWEEPATLADGRPIEGLAGYNIYRRFPGEPYSLTPLNDSPLSGLACKDKGTEPDRDYLYVLRSVRKVRESLVESEASLEITVNTTDRVAPAVPTGLVGIAVKAGVVLRWDSNSESDLKGYYVYRKEEGTEDFRKLTTEPLSLPSYLDESVEQNRTYVYRVTAVDSATRENESDPSLEIVVQYTY